jgi:hypothetical protein
MISGSDRPSGSLYDHSEGFDMDFEAIKRQHRAIKRDDKFLRDLIAIPGESCGEEW